MVFAFFIYLLSSVRNLDKLNRVTTYAIAHDGTFERLVKGGNSPGPGCTLPYYAGMGVPCPAASCVLRLCDDLLRQGFLFAHDTRRRFPGFHAPTNRDARILVSVGCLPRVSV